MYVIASVSSGDSYYSAADYALIDLSPDNIKVLLSYFNIFEKFKSECDSCPNRLESIRFNGSFVLSWFKPDLDDILSDLDLLNTFVVSDEVAQEILDLMSNETVTPSENFAASDYELIVVTEHFIYFEAYEKHTGVKMSSMILSKEDLENCLENYS